MSLIFQQIQDGKVIGNTSAAVADGGEAKTKSNMDENKEMFLKLLVAEMQYQDPMEPKDNSEYVKELSQFTQVETLNSMQDEVEKLSTNTLVGKYVSIEDEDGKTTEGKVDYVTTQSGTSYVSVDGNLYKASDIQSVSDANYFEDTTLASNVEQLISMLPDPDHLTLSDEKNVSQVGQALAGLNDTARSYVSQDAINRLDTIAEKMNAMVSNALAVEAEKEKLAAAEVDDEEDTEESSEDFETEDIEVTEA